MRARFRRARTARMVAHMSWLKKLLGKKDDSSKSCSSAKGSEKSGSSAKK